MNKLKPGTKLAVGSHETEIVSYLAEGGFAHIYTVKYKPVEDGKEIGVLKRVIVKSKADLNLLRREVDTMQKLVSCKYVVRLFDSNAQKLQDGTYEVLLLMEYCPNKSLLDYMNLHLKTKLNFEQITRIMYQVSIGLYAMHSIQLIHRDLKIENVLIDSEGNFKLADFGSSSPYIKPPSTQEEFQQIANDIIHNTTPQYRAPEMIDLYKNIPIDDKSDMWALGVFLYKLMYYTTPFETQGELSILHGYYHFPPQPKYTSKLINLVIIMLQVDPKLRPNVYQVINEICKMIDKPVPVKDIYGLGPYDFEAYEKHQQQLQSQQQLQQQEQLLQQQQQYLQQQRYYEEQRKLQELQAQKSQQLTQTPAKGNPPNTVSPDSEQLESYLEEQPHQLATSSKSSFGDLKKLEDQAQLTENESEEETNDGSKPLQDEEDTVETDLINVEERFPDLDDLDAKYPKILDGDHDNKLLSPSSTKIDSSSSQFSRTPSIKVKPELSSKGPENLGLKLSKTEAWTDIPSDHEQLNVDVNGVFRNSARTGEESQPNFEQSQSYPQGKRLSQPEQTAPIPSIQKKLDVSKKSSFDALFDFEDDQTQQSPSPLQKLQQREAIPISETKAEVRNPLSIITAEEPLLKPQNSRNPFSPAQQNLQTQLLAPQPPQKSEFQQQQQPSVRKSLEIKNPLQPELSGCNPWAQYKTPAFSASNLIPGSNYQSQSQLPPQYQNPQQFQNQNQIPYQQFNDMSTPNLSQPQKVYSRSPQGGSNRGYVMSSQLQSRPQGQPYNPAAASLPQQTQHLISLNNQPNANIPVAPKQNLIDPQDLEKKRSTRPQLNLDMLDLDISSPKPKSKKKLDNFVSVEDKKDDLVDVQTNERFENDSIDGISENLKKSNDDDTDTDSDGGLKVREMKVPESRTTSSSVTNSNKAPTNQLRRSLDLQRMNFDLEMDLSKRNSHPKGRGHEYFSGEDETTSERDEFQRGRDRDKNSRRSVRKTSPILSSKSVSNLRKSFEEHSTKRKSFLGL